MKKSLLIGLIILIILVIVAVLFGIFTNQGKQAAEQENKDRNSIFHTVSEGGTCRSGQGDCKEGLTCNNGVCAKP